MSKRSERREADRTARKLAYQQLRQQHQQQPQPAGTPAEPAATPAPDLFEKAQAFFDRPMTGRAASARNATKHGCCADDTLILKSESIEDYQALESAWFQAYKPKSDAEKHMVQELVNADWFQQRANRTVAQMEAQLMDETPNPMDWTDDQHKKLNRFMRYQTTRSNTCNRIRKALEDFLARRANETIKQERHEAFKEKNKPEPSIDELIDGMLAQKAEHDRLNQQS
jgi:hypothetical protein